MGQYSELIGSFKRMGNFPLEADYIFNSEEELKAFYSQPENYVLLHRGLLRIVADPESNQQYLYWVNRKQTNNDLEFVKLLSFNGIDDLSSKLEDLKNKLNQEIEDRKHADNAIWGVEDKTQIPDDLNSIFDLANSIINLEEIIKDGFEGTQEMLNSIQGELDNTQIGVGLNSDGSYSPDKETFYLKNTTSIMNALKTLDSLINEAIDTCNLEGVKTETAVPESS